MITIIGKKYLTAKEASARYGYSVSWFALRRICKKEPFCMRVNNKSKVLYPLDETDKWFNDKMKKNNE